MVLLLVTVTV